MTKKLIEAAPSLKTQFRKAKASFSPASAKGLRLQKPQWSKTSAGQNPRVFWNGLYRPSRFSMETIMEIERELGNTPRDVSRDNLGYDIESKTKGGSLRFIEAKGRQAGNLDVTVTHNEMKTAANSPCKCMLAVVLVAEHKRTVIYFTKWINAGPSFAESRRVLDLNKLRIVSCVVLEREIERVRGNI
jgi:hypothetical protein